MFVLLTSCGGTISPKEYESLYNTCNGNEGVEYIYVSDNGPGSDYAVCNNGAKIYRSGLK